MGKQYVGQDAGMQELKEKEQKRPENLVRLEQYVRWIFLAFVGCAFPLVLIVIVSHCTVVLDKTYDSQVSTYIELLDKYIPRVGSMAVLLVILSGLADLGERLTFSTFSEGALRKSRAPWFPMRYLKSVVELIRDLNINAKQ